MKVLPDALLLTGADFENFFSVGVYSSGFALEIGSQTSQGIVTFPMK